VKGAIQLKAEQVPLALIFGQRKNPTFQAKMPPMLQRFS
jgi:hypothetical protein